VSRRDERPLVRLLGFAKPYRGRLVAALAAMVVYGVAQAAIAALIKPIFDEVLPRGERLSAVAAAILGLYILKGLGTYLSALWMTDVGQRVVHDLRHQLFRHILNQSAAFFSRQTTGRLLSRLTNDVAQVQFAVSETVGDLTRESLSMVAFAAVLLWVDPRLALLCLTSTPLVVYPLVRLGQRVRRSTRRSQEALEHMSHVGAEAFSGYRVVQAFGAETRESQRFEQASERYYRTNMKVTRTLSVLPPLMEVIGGLAFVAALWYGSQEISAQRLTPGDFVTFITALFMMYGPAKKLSRVNANLQQALAATDRIFDVLDTHSEVTDRPGAANIATIRFGVELQHVRFTFPDADEPTLDGVSLQVAVGQTVAIVGRSGAGKTTIANLVARFYDPTEGAILIDGRDIRDVTVASLRRLIGIVTQETVLFDDTVAANIAYGKPEATREEIEAAARAAHAHEFVAAMERGYDTVIGERGQRLSGGQRQRVAIARALLRDSPLLILDEATSALDAESEMLVQEALATLMEHRTALVIAHRLSTVRRADRIVVLEDGHVAEVGTHEELLLRAGPYAKLYELQLQDQPSGQGS
jgi:subfamily B ATP-binding cassette protein MsbA